VTAPDETAERLIGYVCQSCGALFPFDEVDESAVLRECSRCGTTRPAEETRCEDCHIFTAKTEEVACPDCETGALESHLLTVCDRHGLHGPGDDCPTEEEEMAAKKQREESQRQTDDWVAEHVRKSKAKSRRVVELLTQVLGEPEVRGSDVWWWKNLVASSSANQHGDLMVHDQSTSVTLEREVLIAILEVALGEKSQCVLCHRIIVKDGEHPTAHGYVHEHSGVQFCDADEPGFDAVATPPGVDPS
jgi:hypothetical protein